jgi:hypothetical protein
VISARLLLLLTPASVLLGCCYGDSYEAVSELAATTTFR